MSQESFMSVPHQPPAKGTGAGLDSERVDDLVGRVRHSVEQGPLPSVQIALALNGRLEFFQTFGEGVDNSSRYNIYSCTKPLVAAAIWKLMGEGRIEIDRCVSDYLSEFSGREKGRVTIEQVLCHTAGFPQAPMGPPDWWHRDTRMKRMAGWHLDWEPGSQFVYHATSAHWVLAELIAEVSGCDYRDYINNEILDQLGLEALRLGVPAAQQVDITTLQHVGDPPSAKELEDVFGRAVDWPDMVDESLLAFNDPAVRELGVPGGGAVSNAADVALFYQALMHNDIGLWQPEVLADATANVRVNFPDPMTGVPANRGLGVVIAGSGPEAGYRGMGKTVSASAFGHQGVGGQIAWGDPASGLSFCLLTNGLDINPIRSARFAAGVNNRAGICVK
jgi:CubicO group peptidase (beta-lactamase class C family)